MKTRRGESHGKAIVAILEGFPAGLKVDVNRLNKELKRRQSGFGRGKRMQIENDRVEIVNTLSGQVPDRETVTATCAAFAADESEAVFVPSSRQKL